MNTRIEAWTLLDVLGVPVLAVCSLVLLALLVLVVVGVIRHRRGLCSASQRASCFILSA